MLRQKTHAFTILEIIFFIAISGLIIAIAMNSIGTRQRNVQFTDSMRSLESFIKGQQSATLAGVNDVAIGTGGDSNSCVSSGGTSADCVFLGRVIVFNLGAGASEIEYYSMIGKRMSASDEASCSRGLLFCVGPKTENLTRKYNMLWQTKFIGGEHKSGAENSRSFGYLRNPRGSSMVPVSYREFSNNITMLAQINSKNNYLTTGNPAAHSGNQVDAYYCFSSADNRSKAVITVTGLQVELKMNFSDNDYDC